MADIDLLRKLLAEQFGINSERELDEAILSSQAIDIGLFISPVRCQGEGNPA